MLPHPTLVATYERKVARLREALNDKAVRTKAIAAFRGLIGTVTVLVATDGARTLEVEASTATLIDFAQTTNAPQRGAAGRFEEMVAGTGFEPVTFRL